MKNFTPLNPTDMNKIVGGLLIEHTDYHPDQFIPVTEEENTDENLQLEKTK